MQFVPDTKLADEREPMRVLSSNGGRMPSWAQMSAAAMAISLNSSLRERDHLGFLTCPRTHVPPRAARFAARRGDNGRNNDNGRPSPFAWRNVRKTRTVILRMPRINIVSPLVSRIGPGKGGILELPPLAPCGMLR